MSAVEELFDNAEALQESEPERATSIYRDVLAVPIEGFPSKTDALRVKEQTLLNLSKIFTKKKQAKELVDLINSNREFFNLLSKARSAKIVRTLIDELGKIPDTVAIRKQLCLESIEWAKASKSKFLRQKVEATLAELYFLSGEYSAALHLISELLRELKQIDDKLMLLELQIVESQVHLALRNIAKAKAALTSARTNSNAVYTPPVLQANIDLQAGILQAQEKDYKTAYSYFYEGFESFSTLEDPKAIRALKYMLLCKVMQGTPEAVATILSNTLTLKFSGRDLDAMRAVADAGIKRSLEAFEETLRAYKPELGDDPIIQYHLTELYDALLEKNLVRIIEPFSRVEIAHVAHLINLPLATVEAKLSKMILDKKFLGVLDQGAGTLVVFEEVSQDKTYSGALDVIENMSGVMDSLFAKAKRLT